TPGVCSRQRPTQRRRPWHVETVRHLLVGSANCRGSAAPRRHVVDADPSSVVSLPALSPVLAGPSAAVVSRKTNTISPRLDSGCCGAAIADRIRGGEVLHGRVAATDR